MTPHQLPPAPTTRAVTTAERLANLVGQFAGIDLPVGIRAWDGTEAGPADGPVLVIKSRRALRRLLWAPTELGLARAYVCGDVDGDLGDGLRAQAGSGGLARHQPLTAPPRRLSRWPDWVRLVCRRGHRKPRRDYGGDCTAHTRPCGDSASLRPVQRVLRDVAG
jgi:hypothetical protein